MARSEPVGGLVEPGQAYGGQNYRGVQGNNALYNAIRAHEATIRGTGVTNADTVRRARKERMPSGTNATSPGGTTGGL